ncbi:apolipoprotein L3 isoform X2 [Ursus maritimus]|uniref:Apolipoprotein L3 isoform X2 n=1 Tax=Ursus maritimus TaxID=29073 RepID=A0A384DA24_URSMA|nr:apolipoprotein L3 isoform X2 [Ursus maritimus]
MFGLWVWLLHRLPGRSSQTAASEGLVFPSVLPAPTKSSVTLESYTFVEEVIECFQNTVSIEELHFLLTDHEAWDRFVAEATLSREEADAVREGLDKLDMEAEDQLARERFLSEFPQLKVEFEERIRKLRELADNVDRVHKNCTLSKRVAGSAGVVSGVLTCVGLGLAPFTAGASLTLSAVGAGLGAVSAVTHVSTSFLEDSKVSSAKAEASRLKSLGTDKEKIVAKVLRHSEPQISSLASTCDQELQNIARNVRALRVAYVNARRLMIRRDSDRAIAQFTGRAMSGLSLLMDMLDFVRNSEGAKTESSEEMRRQAQELESKLEELSKIHESLMEGSIP